MKKSNFHVANAIQSIFDYDHKEGDKYSGLTSKPKARRENKPSEKDISNTAEKQFPPEQSSPKKSFFSFLRKPISKTRANKTQRFKQPQQQPYVTKQDAYEIDLYNIESWKAIFKK